MKRLMLTSAFIVGSLAMFASERDHISSLPAIPTRTTNMVAQSERETVKETGLCSFTARGSVSTSVVSFDIACTASEQNCRDAIKKAFDCVKQAMRLAKDHLS